MKRGIIYFAVIFVLGPFSLNANAQAVDLGPYFNMSDARALVYDRYTSVDGVDWVLDGNFLTYVLTVAPTVKLNIQYDLPAVTPTNMDIWGLQPDGHYWGGEVDLQTQNLEIADPPPGPVDGVMDIGVPVTFDFLQRDGAGVVQGAIRVEETLMAANFPYTTTAGTFNDCVLIEIKIFADGFLDETSYWIWARGVGPIVEWITSSDGTQELRWLIFN